MSRLSFVLGITMLVVAGTAVFMMTYERQGETGPLTGHDSHLSGPSGNSRSSRTHPSSVRTPKAGAPSAAVRTPSTPALALEPAATARLDDKVRAQAHAILARTERESRQELDRLTRKYQLTRQQQDELFPYLVAHHEQAHPSMIVNGTFLPVIAPGTTFEDNLAAVLTPAQQDALIEERLADEAWWKDIVGQLEQDLDQAIQNGEMVPADPGSDPVAPTGPTTPSAPAPGDGEASEHGGRNLFDLLGR